MRVFFGLVNRGWARPCTALRAAGSQASLTGDLTPRQRHGASVWTAAVNIDMVQFPALPWLAHSISLAQFRSERGFSKRVLLGLVNCGWARLCALLRAVEFLQFIETLNNCRKLSPHFLLELIQGYVLVDFPIIAIIHLAGPSFSISLAQNEVFPKGLTIEP